jgi:hypothetical protein
MVLQSFIPEPLREFLPYLSPQAFKVVPWLELAKKSLTLATQSRETFELSPIIGVELCGQFSEQSVALDSVALSDQTRREIGQRILKLYFMNILSAKSVWIDFRAQSFRWDELKNQLLWRPTRLSLHWDLGFSRHANALYEAYYTGDHSHLRETLTALGFVSAEESESSLSNFLLVLEKHFGPGDQSEVAFSSRKLAGTLHALFLELQQRGARLKPDFAFLGIMLATMTLTLESLRASLDVRAAFNETRSQKTASKE